VFDGDGHESTTVPAQVKPWVPAAMHMARLKSPDMLQKHVEEIKLVSKICACIYVTSATAWK
jgi:hypothetical protein